jgi:acid phosphatase (class A)
VKAKLALLLLILPLAAVSLAKAQSMGASPAPSKPSKPYYLALTPEQERALIPPPPAKGSAADQQDLAGVLQAQAARTPALVAEAMKDQTYKITLVTSVIGSDFTAAADPAAFALLNHANQDVSFITSYLKNDYQRNRPYVDHPEVKNLFPEKNHSYPSGHSSGSEVMADCLALLFPSQQAALHARAFAIAQSRVTAGVHYPSDIKEGAVLGDKAFALIEATPAFQKELGAAQAEVKQAPASAQPPGR